MTFPDIIQKVSPFQSCKAALTRGTENNFQSERLDRNLSPNGMHNGKKK